MRKIPESNSPHALLYWLRYEKNSGCRHVLVLHRLVASGIDVPVGMKNPTGGDLSVMMNSIYAAMGDHTFLYRGWEVETAGNPYAHAIMRGYVNEKGDSRPNYHYEDLVQLHKLYRSL